LAINNFRATHIGRPNWRAVDKAEQGGVAVQGRAAQEAGAEAPSMTQSSMKSPHLAPY